MTTDKLDCIDEAQTRNTIGTLIKFFTVREDGDTFSSSSLSMSLIISIKTRAGLYTSFVSDISGSSS